MLNLELLAWHWNVSICQKILNVGAFFAVSLLKFEEKTFHFSQMLVNIPPALEKFNDSTGTLSPTIVSFEIPNLFHSTLIEFESEKTFVNVPEMSIKTLKKIIFNFSISTMLIDGLAPLGAWTAGEVSDKSTSPSFSLSSPLSLPFSLSYICNGYNVTGVRLFVGLLI